MKIPLPTPPVSAAASNILGNPDFETGSLDPFWQKWGYPASTAMVLNCCSHTPGTSWVGYIVPNGKWVELQTKGLTVGNQVRAGHTYRLQTWVYTSGMTATVAWWVDDGRGSQQCGTTSSTTWVPISCDFTIPAGTDGKGFNVHIGGNAPSGQWAISDEWVLSETSHFYAEVKKDGDFYGVQSRIFTATPVIREPLFSYSTIAIVSATFKWVETGWFRSPITGCVPRFVWAIDPTGAAQIIPGAGPTVGAAYYYTIFRVSPGNWQLNIADSNGQLVTSPISIPNPGMDSGTQIRAGGEVDSVKELNDMGINGLMDLKWVDHNLAFWPWNGWQWLVEDNPPYHVEPSAPDGNNNVQVAGNQGQPVPAGAPCP